MRNYWKWIIGGGLAFWAFKAYAQTERVGNLAITITFKPGTLSLASVNNALNAMLNMRQLCTGAPNIQQGVQPPAVSGNAVLSVVSALWTHDTMGPIRESVRACYLAQLQARDPNIVNVTAERVS